MEDSSLPKVAILLAAFNGVKWLDVQVDSILQQAGVNITLFISVDKSIDGTEKLVDSIKKMNKNVKALPQGQVFGGAGKNFYRLLTEVDFDEYDYIGLSDQDDIWIQTKIFRAIKIMCDGCYHGYSSNVKAFWAGKENELLIDKAQPQREWDYLFEAAGPGCTYLMKKELAVSVRDCILEKRSTVKEIGLHDWFIYAYARANGFRWVIDREIGLLYRQHDANQVGINRGFSAVLKRIKMFINGYWLEQSLLVADVTGMGKSKFVKEWRSLSFWSLVRLSLKARKCRRRLRDQISFFFLCFVTGFFLTLKTR